MYLLVLPNIGLMRFQAIRGSFGASFEILKHKHSRLEYSWTIRIDLQEMKRGFFIKKYIIPDTPNKPT